jgi:hypothetical protein
MGLASNITIPGAPYQSGLLQIRYYVSRIILGCLFCCRYVTLKLRYFLKPDINTGCVMSASEDIFAKSPDQVGLSDIQKLIDEKREEAHNLEYKSPQILKKSPALSEWISAFLNAGGGVIILGLSESDPSKKNNINAKIYPTKIEFVESDYDKERVEQIIFNNIGCSSKPDIKIYPIRDPNDPSCAVYLIDVPQGDNPPYQAGNKKYYRRLNATKYELSHSEIADFFGRRRKPKLLVTCLVTDPKPLDKMLMRHVAKAGGVGVVNRSSYKIRIVVKNVGHAIAKHARVILSFEGIDIITITNGPNNRIDALRNGMPTLQWDNVSGVIHAGAPGGDVIWDLQIKLQKRAWGTIAWEAQAEDMDYMKGRYVLLGREDQKPNIEPKPYLLPRFEDVFHHNSNISAIKNGKT